MNQNYYTLEKLHELGLTYENGQVLFNGKVLTPKKYVLQTFKKGTCRSYYYFSIYDKDYYKEKPSTHGKRKLVAHRVIYILGNNIDVPNSYDIDHIDFNTANNSLDNLRAIPRSENRCRQTTNLNSIYLNHEQTYNAIQSLSERIEWINRTLNQLVIENKYNSGYYELVKNYKKERENLYKRRVRLNKLLEHYETVGKSKDN